MRKLVFVLFVVLLVATVALAAVTEEGKAAVANTMREATKKWVRENFERIQKWGNETNKRYVTDFGERMKRNP